MGKLCSYLTKTASFSQTRPSLAQLSVTLCITEMLDCIQQPAILFVGFSVSKEQ